MRNKVEVRAELAFIWRAFHDLSGDRQSGDRQSGMPVGRILFLAIDRYATRFGVEDRDEFERFMALIHSMDVAFIKWIGATNASD